MPWRLLRLEKVQKLEKVLQKRWNEVKRESLSHFANVEEFSNLSSKNQANKINAVLVDPLNVYRLHSLLSKCPLKEAPVFFIAPEFSVQRTLSKFKVNKAAIVPIKYIP